MGNYTYVGFGFGAIQPGLLLHDATRSGAFNRYVVAEIDSELVTAMRESGSAYSFNLASEQGVRQVSIDGIELLDVGVENERKTLIQAIAEAHEIGTAITTFNQYIMDIPGSVHLMLAEGLRRKVAQDGPAAVVYCAENNNHAAEMLEQAVMSVIPEEERGAVKARVQFVNTVVSKMCGLIKDRRVAMDNRLVPMWPHATPFRALLVEDYDLLLINQVHLPGYERGIAFYEEKTDLLPFKEAKLFGHNGTHAIGAYLAANRSLTRMHELTSTPDLLRFMREGFVNEIGTALIRKYEGFDPLFTEQGFTDFTAAILKRMVNPYLLDTVARVGRDPRRKLGWDDRIIGGIRLAQEYGVDPKHYGLGAAAALTQLEPGVLRGEANPREVLGDLWKSQGAKKSEINNVLRIVEHGCTRFKLWEQSGFADINHIIEMT